MLENADRAHDLAFLDNTDLAFGLLAGAEVARVTNDLLRLDSLVTAANTDELAVRIRNNLVNGLVEHVSTAVDGTQAGERLWELAETVEGVDVRRLAVPGHRRRVQDDTLICGASGLRLVSEER